MAKTRAASDPLANAYDILRDLDQDEEDEAVTDADADLVLAAYFGDEKGAKRALDRGASPDAKQKTTGFSALWLAVSNDHAPLVKLLLARGADANTTVSTKEGRKTLTFTAIERAAAEGKNEIVALLSRGGARVPQAQLDQALGMAVWDEDAKEVARLCAAGANVNGKTGYNEPLLACAARRGSTQVVAALLKHGADPNQRSDGKPALHDAISLGRIEIVKLLLEAGADANLKHGKSTTAESLLNSKDAKLLELLLAHGLDPNTTVYGDPMLFGALRDQRVKSVEALLRHKADVNLRIKYKQASFEMLYPIDTTLKRKLLTLLLDAGLDVKRLTGCGNPLTTQLVFDGEVSLLKRLLEAGADPALKSAGSPLLENAAFLKDKKKRAAIQALLEKHLKKKR